VKPYASLSHICAFSQRIRGPFKPDEKAKEKKRKGKKKGETNERKEFIARKALSRIMLTQETLSLN
jgi:hypothetical protein